MAPFAKAGAVPPLPEFFHQPSNRHYDVVEQTTGSICIGFRRAGSICEKRIGYVFRSGNHSKTFHYLDQIGQLIELPVSR